MIVNDELSNNYYKTRRENFPRIQEMHRYLVKNFWEYKLINVITGGYFDAVECSIVGLYQALGKIDKQLKDGLLYRYKDGLSYIDVGLNLGNVTEAESKKIIRRGLRELRKPGLLYLYHKIMPNEIQNQRRRLAILESRMKSIGVASGEESNECQVEQEAKRLITIEELDLTSRPYHSLRRYDIRTVGDILKLSKTDFRNMRNLGEKSYEEIKNKVRMLGFDMI